MDGWVSDIWMHGQTDKRRMLDVCKEDPPGNKSNNVDCDFGDKEKDVWIIERMGQWMYGWMDKWMYGHVDGQIEGWTDV